jgi:5'-deoxynucleotidase YfbR-like HD superfamily hydrolase
MDGELKLRMPTGNGRDTVITNVMNITNWRPVYVALAREHRFAGLLPEGCEWTVAHHLLLVAHILQHVFKMSPNVVLAGLGHDMPEGMGLRDLPSPVKHFMRDEGEYGYDALHEDAGEVVDTYLGLQGMTYAELDSIHDADALALQVEQAHFQNVANAPPEPDRDDYVDQDEFDADNKAFDDYRFALEILEGIVRMTKPLDTYGLADLLQDFTLGQMRIVRGEATEESIIAENSAKIKADFNKVLMALANFPTHDDRFDPTDTFDSDDVPF